MAIASRIRRILNERAEAEEDDFFPALIAETYPLPSNAAISRRNFLQAAARAGSRAQLHTPRRSWKDAVDHSTTKKERVA